MELTAEQATIIDNSQNMSVQAFSGTGKQTTITAFILKNRSEHVLLITPCNQKKAHFNKVFQDNDLQKARVETPYSLAHRRLGNLSDKIQNSIPNTFRLKELLSINTSDSLSDLRVASLVKWIFTYYCKSAAQKLSKEMIVRSIYNEDQLDFFWRNEAIIVSYTERLIKLMESGIVTSYEDFYVKQYCMLNPRINSSYIVVDDAQNLPPCLLEAVKKQRAVKLIFGDEHGKTHPYDNWMEIFKSTNNRSVHLNKSFTYSDEIACNMRFVLNKKVLLYENFDTPTIKGLAKVKKSKNQAIISRNNVTILQYAIEYLEKYQQNRRKVHFQGGLDHYLYADEGISLWDVLSLYTKNLSWIENPNLEVIRSIDQLEDYAIATKNISCMGLINLVRKYRKGITTIIKNVDKTLINKSRINNRTLVLSSVLHARNVRRDDVYLLDDFTTEDQIKKVVSSGEYADYPHMEREINILYLAASRATNNVFSPHIPSTHVTGDKQPFSSDESFQRDNRPGLDELPYNPEVMRKKHPGTFRKWTSVEDSQLAPLHPNKESIDEIASKLQRTRSSIIFRLRKMTENR
ncbi:MAG: hypothetical protein WBA74_11625 [Cyclobacteriaceae bacterium]